MFTVYIVSIVVLALSFVTGNIILRAEHKPSKNIIFDEEII